MKMASFLAGFGGGYLKAKDKALEDERRAKQDAWQEEVQGRQRKEWEAKDRLDADLKDAVTPVAVEQPNDVLKDDDGNDMPAVPAFRAGTKRFATMEEATKAANELNTPEAQNTRVLDAYKRNGQFDKALTMQTAMRQGELGEIHLANAKFQQRIGDWMGGGFDGFRDGLNSYEGGPFKGKKVDFVLSADGKTRSVVEILPDGQQKPTGLVVPNSNEGLYQLGYILDKSVTPADRLKMHRDEVRLAIEQQKADTADKKNEAYMQSLLRRAGGGRAASGLNMDALDKQLSPLFVTEDQTTGAKTVNAQGLMAVRQLALYTPSAARGDSTGAALEAYNVYSNALKVSGGDQIKALGVVQQMIAKQRNQAQGQPGEPQVPGEQPGQTVKNPLSANVPTTPPPSSAPEKSQPNLMTRMFPQARIKNLETMAARNTASKAELQELQELKALQGKEWWRGRASDANY